MNAAAVKLPEGTLTDPFNGRAAIAQKIIRCVGKAEERFAEDGLRPLRAVRFAAQLGFAIEDAILAAIPGALAITAKVAPERLRDEIDKIIASKNPRRGFLFMEETGLLKLVLPELAACRGVDQKGYHRFDVLDHSLFALDYAAKAGCPKEVRMAALFHDIGKPAVRKFDEESSVWTFYNHEKESVKLTENILRRFRYPNAPGERILRLIAGHMFHYEENWGNGAVRRFIKRTGEDLLDELFELRMADAAGTAGTEPGPLMLLPLKERIDKVFEQGNALSLKSLAVNGRDLIGIGVEPGKHVGIILNELLETVLDDPELNTREKLLEIAGKINQRYE
jgi:putative nucleotidyltransferase with HDIG domain